MASSALEEKINKIRQQNEEIRRRYEEVEEDKKNAAKLNALVQMVPSTDWPERKEPPEFSNPPKTKPKLTKEKHEYVLQSHIGEGKKIHSFAQGEGPPPDPKYNFLADSEREEPSAEYTKESNGNRSYHKVTRGSFRKKASERESSHKDNKPNKGNYRDESQPGYDAWRAERNRIDEDRISRQRTAEGNWRREWDNDKVHIIDDVMKKSRPTLGDFTKKDHKESDRRYHVNNNEHVNYTRGGGHRPHRGSTKNFYSNYENRSHNTYDQHRNNIALSAKTPVSPTSEERTVVATEKSIKVTVNQSNVAKGPVMSVKVNSPSIAGTGRVGPRQRTRVTYSHSDVDTPSPEGESFFRQKSFEDKSKGTYFNNQKFSNLKRSHSQKKKENETKYHHQKKDMKKEDSEGNSYKHYENEFKSYVQKDQQKSHSAKSPKLSRGNTKTTKQNSSNVIVSQKRETQECSASDEVKLEQSEEAKLEQSEEAKLEQNEEAKLEQNEEAKLEQNEEAKLEQNEEAKLEQNEEAKLQQNDEVKHEQNNEAKLEQNDEMNLEQNDEVNIEYNTKQNTERDVTSENGNTLQESKSEVIEVCNTENEQSNIENDIKSKVSLMKEAEPEEMSLTSVSGTDNPEQIAKDDVNKNSFEDKNEYLDCFANNVIKDLQESSNTSSEASVPNNVQSDKELVPNKSNDVSNNAVKIENALLCKDNQVLSEQVIKQFANDDCDNIEGETKVQRSTEELTDNSVSLLETHSVIEIDNQSVCNNELVQEETLNLEKEIKKSNESSDKNLEDVMNSSEIKSENNFSLANVDENLIKENTGKNQEAKNEKEGKVNVENDKTLQ